MGTVIQLPKQDHPAVCDFASYTTKSPIGGGRLIGLVLEISNEKNGPLAKLWLLRLNKSVRVPLSECRKVSLSVVQGGLVGLYTTDPLHAGHRVVREMLINNVLHFVLRDKRGNLSKPVSIREVRFSFMSFRP